MPGSLVDSAKQRSYILNITVSAMPSSLLQHAGNRCTHLIHSSNYFVYENWDLWDAYRWRHHTNVTFRGLVLPSTVITDTNKHGYVLLIISDCLTQRGCRRIQQVLLNRNLLISVPWHNNPHSNPCHHSLTTLSACLPTDLIDVGKEGISTAEIYQSSQEDDSSSGQWEPFCGD